MAKAKTKFPLDAIGGVIAGPDRTIGRDVGLNVAFREINNGTAGDKNNQRKTQIYATTAPTRGGSVARHTRAKVYCNCDGAYKTLTPEKKVFLKPWWMAATGGAFVSMGPYQIYMKVCLKGLLEYQAFLHFGYCTRYQIKNNDTFDWLQEEVIFTNIPTFQADGMDVEVYLLLPTTTKKGRITYDAKMIDYRLEHEVIERGKIRVFIPIIQSQSSVFVDVYSYYNGIDYD
jgi:hypothetical protein